MRGWLFVRCSCEAKNITTNEGKNSLRHKTVLHFLISENLLYFVIKLQNIVWVRCDDISNEGNNTDNNVGGWINNGWNRKEYNRMNRKNKKGARQLWIKVLGKNFSYLLRNV